MLRRLFYIFITLFITTSAQGLIIEPFIGTQILTSDSGDNSKLSLALGGQIGFLLKRVVLAGEYQTSDIVYSTSFGTTSSIKLQTYSAVATIPMSPTTKIYARYTPYFKFGDSSYVKGSGFGIGFGYRLVHRLFVNFDYTSLSASERVSSTGTTTPLTKGYGKFMVSLSLPLNF